VSDDHGDHIGQLYDRIAQLEGRLERMFRPGTVTDVDVSDPSKPRARIGVGVDDQGQPVKGPSVPFSTFAGARNVHSPVSVGQQMMQLAPDGDFEQAVLLPLGHSDQVKAPSTDPGTFVDGTGGTDIRFKDGKHQVKAGDKAAHLVTDKGQRLAVEDISKLVIKIGNQAFMLKMSALQPTQDLDDF